tara:strand:- start:157 stop:537 length:381 start_codon:yes stop_codon:yes gene_type:complete
MDAYNDIFGTTAKALDLRSKRMEMISSNIANADVAGYKAKDIDFRKMMAKEMQGTVNNTDDRHLGGIANEKMNYIYRVPVNPSDNGNTVEMNYEQAQFGRESTRYAATLQFLESRVGGLRRALRGE